MFEGFETQRIAVKGAEIHLVRGGSGPPVLLIHGYPQTHAMWHKIAPTLAEHYTLVAPDMRGYGASSKPPAGDDHTGYSKRTMASDLVEVMRASGFERFAVVGHDRGARTAYRMALDHPDRVEQLVVLDILPTLEQFEQLGWLGSHFAYHWHFLAQPAPLPETLIEPCADYFIRHTLQSWCDTEGAFSDEAMAAYVEAFTPDTIRGTCGDYRAGFFVDTQLDRADREAGRRIRCQTLVLWGDRDGNRPSALDTWKKWADNVRGGPLPCGHFIPEEAPAALLAELLPFLGTPPG